MNWLRIVLANDRYGVVGTEYNMVGTVSLVLYHVITYPEPDYQAVPMTGCHSHHTNPIRLIFTLQSLLYCRPLIVHYGLPLLWLILAVRSRPGVVIMTGIMTLIILSGDRLLVVVGRVGRVGR